ncbi:VIT1/CCC1 transporter family protein [Miltoncostaea marina]|uniref:VIT1/CCC1 transporter family protein n=1 Tax=Miltoncostaea marina TaxID=2843215 RepID=UPI001C3D0954|nr:VIT1/CCC1 family protein [Miltoncostaea marina]
MGHPDAARWRRNFQDEIESAELYRRVAEAEDDAVLAGVYRRLAEAEERHAAFWAERLREAGEPEPSRRIGWRTRLIGWLARRFGPGFVVPAITAQESADAGAYDAQAEAAHTAMPGEERSHARLLRAISRGGAGGVEGPALARLEGRHRAASGNSLRAAVLGANDGLLSNFSLVMGVAGARLGSEEILITGVAGLVAGAGSMAMGEWISVLNARELFGRQVAVEREELEAFPDEEREELALIYEAKGLPPDQAGAVADRLMASPEHALDTLSREELGIDPDDLGGSPVVAAATSFALFAVGAVIPIIPFLVLGGTAAVAVAAGLSVAALFGLGAVITLMTGRGVLFSGMRQVAIGLAAAALTYGLGALIGAGVG